MVHHTYNEQTDETNKAVAIFTASPNNSLWAIFTAVVKYSRCLVT